MDAADFIKLTSYGSILNINMNCYSLILWNIRLLVLWLYLWIWLLWLIWCLKVAWLWCINLIRWDLLLIWCNLYIRRRNDSKILLILLWIQLLILGNLLSLSKLLRNSLRWKAWHFIELPCNWLELLRLTLGFEILHVRLWYHLLRLELLLWLLSLLLKL